MEYSPVLAIVTGTLEIAAAVFFIIKIRQKKNGTLILISILFLLAGYQILEALNCSGVFYGRLTRAAYIDITWLPPLGMLYIAGRQDRQLLRVISYIYLTIALAFSIWYIADADSVRLSHCENVIAAYFTHDVINLLYSLYYQSGILFMAAVPSVIRSRIADAGQKNNLLYFQLGVIFFMIPSLIAVMVSRVFSHALPSVMCHFALILAVFIVIILNRESQPA